MSAVAIFTATIAATASVPHAARIFSTAPASGYFQSGFFTIAAVGAYVEFNAACVR
jgi:hypothetical protein